jgi:hypothetical protein
MLRVAAGELTREQADQESLRQGAGRIYNHLLSTLKADLARRVWLETFGPGRPLTDAAAAELGNALSFRHGLFGADLLHTPKGAERKALAELRRKAAAVNGLLDELVIIRAAKDGDGFEGVTFAATGPKGKTIPRTAVLRDRLSVRLWCRGFDAPLLVSGLLQARGAAEKAIEGYRASERLETRGESTAHRVVHELAHVFEKFSQDKARAPLADVEDPDWSFVHFVYAAIRLFEIPYRGRQGGKPGRKPSRAAKRPNQPKELPGLSIRAIAAALATRGEPTGVLERAFRREVRKRARAKSSR